MGEKSSFIWAPTGIVLLIGVDIEKGESVVDWLKTGEQSKPLTEYGKILGGIGGFASLLLDNGLNFTVATAETDFEAGGTQDASTFKVGYKMGMHAFSIDVGDGENAAGQEGDTTGFTYAVFPHPGVELFATVRTLDSTGVAGSQSADITAIGSRIKF